MLTRAAFVLIIAAPLVLTACAPDGLAVTAAEFGDDWPLITATAALSCPASDQPVVTVNRRRYALNDTAKAAGFSEITPVLRRSPDPQLAALNVKAEIAPLRARALQLCTPAP
ncbi:MAG: DUF2511 domain-containing protein [Vicinamibacterales bacterium]|nr:DUF2511 domain-containing protein [Vicinamibacterales bacterium]